MVYYSYYSLKIFVKAAPCSQWDVLQQRRRRGKPEPASSFCCYVYLQGCVRVARDSDRDRFGDPPGNFSSCSKVRLSVLANTPLCV